MFCRCQTQSTSEDKTPPNFYVYIRVVCSPLVHLFLEVPAVTKDIDSLKKVFLSVE